MRQKESSAEREVRLGLGVSICLDMVSTQTLNPDKI